MIKMTHHKYARILNFLKVMRGVLFSLDMLLHSNREGRIIFMPCMTAPHNRNYVVFLLYESYTTSPNRSIFLRCSVPVLII